MADESRKDGVHLGCSNPTPFPIWPIVISVLCLLAVLPVVNFMAHALWLSGHPVEGVGAAGEAWGRRADVWFGVLVVLVAGLGWSVWRMVKWRRSMLKRV